MSETFKNACEKNDFQISKLMLEVSISCYGRWITRDQDTIELNEKSLGYRAILEEVISPFIPESHNLVIRGQSLPSSSYSSKLRYS